MSIMISSILAARPKGLAHVCNKAQSLFCAAACGRPRIHRETRERVRAEAQRLGYVANGAARVLKQRSSSVVGLAVPNIRNRFYSSVAKTMADAASERARQLMLFTTMPGPHPEDVLLRPILVERCSVISAPLGG
jgi:LacI family transcriptional regulator